MQRRRRKQTGTVAGFANDVRAQEASLPPGVETHMLLRKARRADTSGLQPPK